MHNVHSKVKSCPLRSRHFSNCSEKILTNKKHVFTRYIYLDAKPMLQELLYVQQLQAQYQEPHC